MKDKAMVWNVAGLVCAGLLMLGMTGCGGDGPTTGSSMRVDTTRAPRSSASGGSGGSADVSSITNDAWKAFGYRLAWRGYPGFSRRSGFLHVGSFDSGVLVMDTQNTVSLLARDSGRTLWISQVGNPRTKFVGSTIAGDRVYCASDVELYILDIRTGDLLDRQSLSAVVETPPVVFGDVAVFGSTTGEVIGHSLYTGYKLWGYQLNGSVGAAPVNIGGVAGVVSQAGDVLFLDPRDGRSLGRGRVFGGVRNALSSDDRTMYIASEDQSVYAFDARDGHRVWRYRCEEPLSGNPALYEGVLYIEIPGQGLTAINALGGEVVWHQQGLRGEVVGAQGDMLLVWSGNTMRTVDVEDGAVLAEATIADAVGVISAARAGDAVYVLERGGSVAKYASR